MNAMVVDNPISRWNPWRTLPRGAKESVDRVAKYFGKHKQKKTTCGWRWQTTYSPRLIQYLCNSAAVIAQRFLLKYRSPTALRGYTQNFSLFGIARNAARIIFLFSGWASDIRNVISPTLSCIPICLLIAFRKEVLNPRCGNTSMICASLNDPLLPTLTIAQPRVVVIIS